ncbi:MAG TPA: hypothetical protein ENH10_01225 [Bacteroidetes bacterium]|nr:hypothetical protein BMS3Bbin04_01737 [bacterium BMS3Bbin04]HDO64641.1 hypothetical protein [Bacteroidota bacterium]HEX03766.1 hypothetical protein [Bacteroidota bacterium]
MTGDWLALAMERVQAAKREVRLTLPPGQHSVFWTTLLERARLIPNRLTFHILLPENPSDNDGLGPALDALPDLDLTRHVVSLSAGKPFPFFVLLTDRDAAMVTVGDAYNGDDITIVQTTDDVQYVADFVDSFDRRFADGVSEPDLFAWRDWLQVFPKRKEARSALSMLERGRKKLERTTRKTLGTLPRRRFWIIKPGAAAWGMEEKDGLPFEFWLKHFSMHLGWPGMAEFFHNNPNLPHGKLRAALKRGRINITDITRMRATAHSFLNTMHERDRVIAMDGWTSKQKMRVQIYAWGKVSGNADLVKAQWPLARPMQWRELDLRIPVRIVRECTGLKSATFPIHQVQSDAFRALMAATESRAANASAPQLSLTLDLFANKDNQV